MTFDGVANSFSFANVSSSSGTASAFATNGTFLQSLAFSDYPDTLSFGATGIHSINFSGSQYGVDNFTFDSVQAAVPEPATWAMMLLGFGAIGVARRRRRSKAPQTA